MIVAFMDLLGFSNLLRNNMEARNYSKLVSFIAGLKMKKVCSGRKENKLYL